MAKRKKMHTKRHLSHEELRSDKFLESSATIFKYVMKRKEQFIIGLIAAIVLISVGNRYLLGKEKSHAKAEFELTMAHRHLVTGDLENALFQYRTITEQYGGSKQGKQAHYWLGEANYGLGKYGEAIEEYEKFLSASSHDDVLSPSALGNIAACHEAVGDFAVAATSYRRIYDKFPRSSLSGWACVRSGICFEKAGEYEKAEEMYRIAIDKYGDFDFAAGAKQNLTFLKGKLQAQAKQ